eukprot:9399645-Pyramimonas_sp.AAC.1
MRAVYEFVRASYDRPKVFWRSCRYECWVMATLCIHLQSPLSLPWASDVIATDASTTGMGVTEAKVPKGVVADVGRWRERWRYRRLEPSEWAPRARALDGMDEITLPHTAWEN